MHEHRYHGTVERLRSPERVAQLEVERVVTLCLEGIAALSVLDVGTGTGLFAEAFVARGLEVTGIDANPAMIEAAQRLVPQAQFQQATAEEIHKADRAFDLVFLGLILHEADDVLQALCEAQRLARLRVAVLEWPYQEQEPGPPLADRLRPEQIVSLALEAGFGTVDNLPLAHTVLYRLT